MQRTLSVGVEDSSLRSADMIVVVADGIQAAAVAAEEKATPGWFTAAKAEAGAAGIVGAAPIGCTACSACRACRSELTEEDASPSILEDLEWSWNSLVVDASSRSGSLPAATASVRSGDREAGPVSLATPATLRSRVRLLETGLDAE